MEIVLRPYREEDATAFTHAVHESLDTLTPWMTWAHADFTEQEARCWFAVTRLMREKGSADELGLFAKDGRLLGGAGLRFSPEEPHLCSIGYWVRSSEQRKGIASEAVRRLVALAWQTPNRDTVEILAAEDNVASRGVAVRSGAKFMGILYGLVVLDSGPVNTAVYHFLRPER
ncbi:MULTISPECIES: GNAT family N-acetyltransferase [Erwinia]|uniref:GNAT family N-acetyltransferase n=1 Tax=Erwinia TaxID=551 RepID=UPI00054EAB4E|nr:MULTISPECIES: GNAT family N-acetyltransferase [Erwinia]